jgi:CRISPR-associated exonuclease Cas4
LIAVSKQINREVKKIKSKHKIQDGKIKYSDLNNPGKPFYSKRYKIKGKPDYIIQKDNHFIPVEVKSGAYKKPQKSHIIQLAGYCQLLEENYETFVPFGILVYNDGSQYKIPFNPSLRFEFESSLKNMRYTWKTGRIIRNHMDSFKCKNCSMKTYCDVTLF